MVRKGQGWHGESRRHGLSRKGVRTVIDDKHRLAVNNFVARGAIRGQGQNPYYKEGRGFAGVDEIILANEWAGRHFFSPKTMKFFKSRVDYNLYNGKYFVTSEKPPYGARHYTIRMANPTGTISTVGEFGEYSSLNIARRVASQLE